MWENLKRDWQALLFGGICGLSAAAVAHFGHQELLVTKVGYLLFPMSGIAGISLIEYKKRRYVLAQEAERFLTYLQHILGAITLRVGWFSVSRAFPTDNYMVGNAPHNQWMWENKVYMAIVAGFWFATYVYKLVNEISHMDQYETGLVVLFVLLAAGGLGWFG